MSREKCPPSLHANHRERMRERAGKFGYESFSDHEILEMFLYASQPRGDTNELAHRLIEHFGVLDAIFEADIDELVTVSGVGPAAAHQLTLCMEMIRRILRSRHTVPRTYDTVQKIAEYVWNYFFGLNHERLYLMLFDNRMALLSLDCLSDGTVNSTAVPKRELLEKVLKKHAACVVLAHNHPHGVAQCSDEDIRVTVEIAELLRSIGVSLREHLIITDTCFHSIMKNHYRLPQVMSDAGARVGDDDFDWDAFYNVDENTYRFSVPKTMM